MKRLCLILAFLFLFTQTSSALLLPTPQVVYRGTVTGLRISAVDGTAFIDNLPYTYSSDFSVGVDGWSAVTGAVTGNIDGIGGQDNTLRFTCNTTNESHYISRASVFTIGKKYQVDFKYYIPSGQSNIDGLRLPANYWGVTSDLTTLDSWTTVSKTFTATTNTSLRIYFLDGNDTTFQDPGGDDVFYIKDITISEITPYMDGNHQIEIYDASNRMLRGVLKAVGSSETLGDETFVDVGFADAGSWSVTGTNPTWVVTGGKASVTNSSGIGSSRVLQNVGGNLGTLFKVGGTVDVLSSGAICVTVSGVTGDSPNITTTGSFNRYIAKSLVTSSIGFRCSLTGTTAQIDDVSCKQVLTPSSSGCSIVSQKGGDVYNFSYKNASFTYNAASYYVIIRAIR